LLIIEIVYFRIANFYNIIDKPNNRSSHKAVTIRGGGIIFTISTIAFFILYQFPYPYFISGLLIISLISFLDDILTLSNRLRLGVHLVSVGLLLHQVGTFSLPWYIILTAFIFVIGTINAYNFMDGINGITGLYSLVTIVTFYYINNKIIVFTSNALLITTFISLIVFGLFNVRKKAKTFAGDVGSVGIAFIILFQLLQLIVKTGNLWYILLLLLYGLDTVTTIIFRLLKKEDVFEAHRSHFYQYWANERNKSHILVSLGYSIVQLLVNLSFISLAIDSTFILILVLFVSSLIFILLRFYTEGSIKLLGR
jgi:UDP-N-acetylmuramyl pentapeptide phosphotransferase/UDP-N-acetylglucosamine-1-phosphate transferase